MPDIFKMENNTQQEAIYLLFQGKDGKERKVIMRQDGYFYSGYAKDFQKQIITAEELVEELK